MAKLKDTEINGNLVVDGDVNTSGNLETDGYARINNNVIVKSPTVDVLRLTRTGSTNASTIGFGNDNGMLGYIGMTDSPNGGLKRWPSDLSKSYTILDSNNVGSYALPITGGTVTGLTTFEKDTTIKGYLQAENTTNVIGQFRTQGDLIGFFKSYSDAYANKNRVAYITLNGMNNLYIMATSNIVLGTVVAGNGVLPGGNDYTYLGNSSFRWKTLYSVNAVNTSSDRNLKKNITPLSDKYEALFNELKPVSFERTFSESDRVHVGFISQDVEESLENVGLTATDFAGFGKDIKQEKNEKGEFVDVLDENGNPIYEYSLRYEEFIALNTHMIQKQQKEIEDLKDEISTLKEEINVLKELYRQGVKG